MSTWTDGIGHAREAQRHTAEGYRDGLADGARGRGSRARYRRAVVAAIGRWTYYRREASDRAAATGGAPSATVAPSPRP